MNKSESVASTAEFERNILDGVGMLGILFDGFCAIFLLNEFRYPKSPLRSPYFVILTPGLIVTVLGLLVRVMYVSEQMPTEVNFKAVVASVIQWFSINALGIWIFILGLNRCTAIMSPALHARVG